MGSGRLQNLEPLPSVEAVLLFVAELIEEDPPHRSLVIGQLVGVHPGQIDIGLGEIGIERDGLAKERDGPFVFLRRFTGPRLFIFGDHYFFRRLRWPPSLPSPFRAEGRVGRYPAPGLLRDWRRFLFSGESFFPSIACT